MTIEQELKSIYEANDGTLRAEDVVEYAKDPATALHERFIWDDTEAARQHRLWQARQIIQEVKVIYDDTAPEPVMVRVYASLPSDRKQEGGGYRSTEDILADPERKRELFQMLKRELERTRAKLNSVKGYASFKAAIDHAIEEADAASDSEGAMPVAV